MSENKFKKIMEILEKVIKINAVKGTRIVATLYKNSLHICDGDNGCEPLIEEGTIYFEEYWDNEFEDLIFKMNKALDQYLV